MIRNVLWVDCAPSTNDIAWCEGHARRTDVLVVVADRQTAGRGRHGRAWHAPAGKDLLFSVFLRPPRPLVPAGVATALGAVAVCETLERNLALGAPRAGPDRRHPAFGAPLPHIHIRWPNDLYVGRRKICGILAESRGGPDGGGAPAYVVGVGLNVNAVEEDWPPDIRVTATSIRRETGRDADRQTLLAAILDRFEALYTDFLREGAARLEAAWRNRTGLGGRRARLLLADGAVSGTVLSAGLAEGIVLEADGGRRAFPPERVLRVEPLET